MENGQQWNRGELKGRSKAVLHMHYWRVVFMTVLLSLFIGSGSIVSGALQPILNEIRLDSEIFPDRDRSVSIHNVDGAAGSGILGLGDQVFTGKYYYGGVAFFAIVVVAAIVLSFIVAVSAVAVEIFVVNPLYVGIMRFYVRSFDTKPQ